MEYFFVDHPISLSKWTLQRALDRILTISRGFTARIRGNSETRANLETNGGGPIKIGAF